MTTRRTEPVPPAKGSRRAPAHLSAESRKLWGTTVRDYSLEDEAHSLKLLTLACEALDRCEDARAALAEHGTTYEDRWGCPKPRPEVANELPAKRHNRPL
jgi:phage terminase small subunit